MLNEKYIQAMQGSPDFRPDEIVRLSHINSKVWEVYQNVRRVDIPGFFEFSFNAYFSKTDPLEMQYVCMAIAKLDELVKYYQQIRAEKEQYYRKLKNGPNA